MEKQNFPKVVGPGAAGAVATWGKTSEDKVNG
jgi:hypothetical protein